MRRYKLAEWWHLLSLDAPTVAVLWAWFLARSIHFRLQWAQASLLALVTWLFYVADRLLDGLQPERVLRERHIFHARHRRAFLIAAIPCLIFAISIAAGCIEPIDFWRAGAILSLCSLIYFLAVHARTPAQSSDWLPKEFGVGALFSAGAATPAWSNLAGRPILAFRLAPEVLVFAALCWINCVAIDRWERRALGCETSRVPTGMACGAAHLSTRWAGEHIRSLTAVVALFSIAAAYAAPTSGLSAVYAAFLLSSCLLFVLDALRARLSPMNLRIAADLALLTPLVFLPVLR